MMNEGKERAFRRRLRTNLNRPAASTPTALGISKRELFTVLAMHGLLSHGGENYNEAFVAKRAKAYADAVLTSLSGQEESTKKG